MRVAGVLHIFQFETKQGEEICVALQTHINDVMLRRYSKARSATSGSTNGDLSNNFKPSDVEMYEKRVQDLSKAVEESQRNADQNLEDEIKLRSEELQAKDEIIRRLTDEKLLLEQRISGIEKTKADEIDFLEKKNEQERKALKLRVLELEKKLEGVHQELAVVKSTLATRTLRLLHCKVT
ncbi:Kinesin-like calmodulin-binding protein [Prunus yedoensis var. nudiflora]|uniref:Kinesin-like calmodulin-binding protein n=1 Tax=Prunus yedoensis var. nudiflora TaxID=2094558 RepID=A0A314ZB26_PRUYE|nr:Kinesin-like calmodulin-binding protein [Prunus yedoensis var. nudiflora]